MRVSFAKEKSKVPWIFINGKRLLVVIITLRDVLFRLFFLTKFYCVIQSAANPLKTAMFIRGIRLYFIEASYEQGNN